MSELLFDTGAGGYDRVFGHVTQRFIPGLLRCAHVSPGQRVLDVATGTGLAAQAAADAVGRAGRVIAVDISRAMIDQARHRMSEGLMTVAASDGQSLAFRDGSFDTVLCQLGLMYFPAPARGLAEFHRVLRPGGRSAVAVATTPERSVLGRVNVAIARHAPADRTAADRLFSLGDPRRLRALLEEAGFLEVQIATETATFHFPSFEAYFDGIERGWGSAGEEYVKLAPETRRIVRAEVQRELGDTGGAIELEVEIRFGSGCR
jgi:ubiquinone/menaquinone biosynthesis C-methylase UbiE